jgi:iron complex outermembrane receptor protein
MVDGRTVYSPLFSGVFWDTQNMLLEDLDRIEVISGPGGTLWGANAVNGVINIVSRSSAETQGLLVDARAGFVDRSVGLRYGGRLDESTTFRVYGLGFERDHSLRVSGREAFDDWENLQGGFRADWSGGSDAFTLQGDTYHITLEDVPNQVDQAASGGANVLARWSHDFATGATLRVQAYYDKAWRETTSGIRAVVDSYDVDAQYAFTAGSHSIVVGGGYRGTHDTFRAGADQATLLPHERTLHRENLFAQDSIALSDALAVTVGLKLEDNSYTGLEYMPDARIAWQVSDTALLWGAVSRAVRTPARFDRDLYIDSLLGGGPDFESENVIAYEVGYRGRPFPSLSLSVSAFYNVYDDLRTVEMSAGGFPLLIENGMEGDGYGVEAWGTYEIASWWRLSAGLSTLHKDLKFKPGSQDVVGLAFAGNDPDYQVLLRSSMNFGPDIALDVFARHIDDLPSPTIDAYTEINARLGWRVTDSLELAIVGADLIDSSHEEFTSPSLPRREIRRSIYLSAVWKS